MAEYVRNDTTVSADNAVGRTAEVLESYRTIVTNSSAPTSPTKPPGQIVRAAVALFTLADIVNIIGPEGRSWCAVLSEIPTPGFTLDLGDDIRSPKLAAQKRILADHVDDTFDAVSQLLAAGWEASANVARLRLVVEEALRAICEKFAVQRLRRENLELNSAEEVADILGCSVNDVTVLKKSKGLVWVTTWTGEERYPKFQFDGDRVCSVIQEVLPEIASMRDDSGVLHGLHGWPLALFLERYLPYGHTHNDPEIDEAGTFVELLTGMNLWSPHLQLRRTRSLDSIQGQEQAEIKANTELFRVQEARHAEPFYFTSYDENAGIMPGSGRLDLPQSTGRGTWYVADNEKGAWREVLDQHPVLTLDDIVGRSRWTLKPLQNIANLAEATGGRAALTAARRRRDTLDVARRIAAATTTGGELLFRGIRYCLNKDRNGHGYAFFGPTGQSQPGDADLGPWEKTSKTRAVGDGDLWSILAWRELREPEFPVILKRFPGENPTPPSSSP
jgi:hypothetical protein